MGSVGTLYLGGTAQTTGAVTLSGGNITSGSLNGSSYAATAGNISTALTGSGVLNKTTSGTLIVSGASTYTGGTSMSGGTIIIDAPVEPRVRRIPPAVSKSWRLATALPLVLIFPSPSTQAWPAVLQSLLGANFTVYNEGHSGATAMADGSLPYNSTSEYSRPAWS